jgi:hypothetical protein
MLMQSDADPSLPTSAAAKNEWSSTSTRPTCLQGVNRDNLTFTFRLSFIHSFYKCVYPWKDVLSWVSDAVFEEQL